MRGLQAGILWKSIKAVQAMSPSSLLPILVLSFLIVMSTRFITDSSIILFLLMRYHEQILFPGGYYREQILFAVGGSASSRPRSSYQHGSSMEVVALVSATVVHGTSNIKLLSSQLKHSSDHFLFIVLDFYRNLFTFRLSTVTLALGRHVIPTMDDSDILVLATSAHRVKR